MASASLPLAVPDYFKFEWDSPEEAVNYWTVDLMHWPHGLSPLTATMDAPAFIRGMTQAANQLCMPFVEMKFKAVHGYVYMSATPYSLDPEKMQERMGQMQAQMMNHVPGLLDRWTNEYEPEVRGINEDVLSGAYGAMEGAALADLLEVLVKKREREGLLHFLAVFPAGGGVSFFEQVYEQTFGKPKGNEHLQLLQGFPNKSTEANTGLWRLGVEARRRPEVMRLLRSEDPAKIHGALGESKASSAFHSAVDEWLDVYGWRANEMDIGEPSWREDPSTAYKLIAEYARQEGADPEQELKSLASARQAREDALFSKLPDGQAAGLMRMALGAAQQYLPIQENHNFWIDQQGQAVLRVPTLAAGRWLVGQGRMNGANDVFFLNYEELHEVLRGGKGDLREIVSRRRREREEDKALTPPPELGTPPPPEMAEDNPMFGKFFGAPPPENLDPRIINGNAASTGKVTGVARVILSLDDAERLKAGEILVCPATMPPWTPLFSIASGVVTDHGGVLSHTAVVAREYGIPAIVGTKVATTLIRDGQKISVDGDAGTVTLEE